MKTISPYLTLAGTLPFVLCAYCFIAGIEVIALLGSTEQVLSVYGLVIASFMAGSHWGQHLSINNQWQRLLPAFSNINAVFLWLSFLVFSFKLFMIALIISFLGSLLIDQKLRQTKIITRTYFWTRCLVTLIVISSLIISGIYA
ncbi:MAG: DUF3429 domain-containing protein [Psychromonas sp.]